MSKWRGKGKGIGKTIGGGFQQLKQNQFDDIIDYLYLIYLLSGPIGNLFSRNVNDLCNYIFTFIDIVILVLF